MNRMYRISDEKIKGVSDREIMELFPDVWVYREKNNPFHEKMIVERERNNVGGQNPVCFIYYRAKEIVDARLREDKKNGKHQEIFDYFINELGYKYISDIFVSDSRKISDADVIGDIYMHCEKMSGDKEMLSQYLDKQYFKYGMITYPEYEMICEDYDIKPHKRGF